MDELAILKHTGDTQNLEQALELRRAHLLVDNEETYQSMYNFSYLAQLFVGRCIKVDGEKYCPHDPIHVSEIDEIDLEE